MCSQGMSIATGLVLTSISITETVCATNIISRLCFASGTVLNGLGTVCSSVNMVRRSNRGLDPFGVFLNSLGAGYFWGGKHCQRVASITNLTKFFKKYLISAPCGLAIGVIVLKA